MLIELEHQPEDGDEQAELHEDDGDVDTDTGALYNIIGGRKGDIMRVMQEPRGSMSGAKGKDQIFRSTRRR